MPGQTSIPPFYFLHQGAEANIGGLVPAQAPPYFLKQTQNKMLTLSADDSYIVKWKCDSSYAVHLDMKSHTGAFMIMDQGVVTSISKKQKLNTKSSTEVELVSSDDIMGYIL